MGLMDVLVAGGSMRSAARHWVIPDDAEQQPNDRRRNLQRPGASTGGAAAPTAAPAIPSASYETAV